MEGVLCAHTVLALPSDDDSSVKTLLTFPCNKVSVCVRNKGAPLAASPPLCLSKDAGGDGEVLRICAQVTHGTMRHMSMTPLTLWLAKPTFNHSIGTL